MNSINYPRICVVLIIMNTLIICIERNQKMNNHNEQKRSHCFVAKDRHGATINLEWHKTNVVSHDFAADMKNVWPFARDAYVPVEMEFLKQFPQVVGDEAYFKPFEPLFSDGVEQVDWNAATATMESILQGHFIFDPAQLPEQVIAMFAHDDCFFVAAKDGATEQILGFITFLMRASYAAGDIKVMSFAVAQSHQNRGIGKLLMSSIFKIVPDIKRIFLCTRVTNGTALKAYSSWGFVTDKNPVLDHAFNLAHWSFMEYKTTESDILQKVAQTLTEQTKMIK